MILEVVLNIMTLNVNYIEYLYRVLV